MDGTILTTEVMKSGAEALLKALKSRKGWMLFSGIPAGRCCRFMTRFFSRTAIRHILVRHEQAAVHAAEGYASAPPVR